MTEPVLVSSITPCFRMGKYLKIFLDQLPQQTLFDQTEIVLDHNEPNPEEVALVKEFQQKYPGRLKHLVVNEVDPIGVSMNRCIREAQGAFLTIWNVDDLRTPNSLELQVSALQTSGADVAFGNFVEVNRFPATVGVSHDFSKYDSAEFTRSMIFGPFFMFRKQLCARAGLFDEQLRSGADFDFAIRLAFNGKAVGVFENLGYYLNEGLGASTRPNSLQAVERTVIELRYGIWDKLDFSLLERALDYNIKHVQNNGQWAHVGKYVPNFGAVMDERRALQGKGLQFAAYIALKKQLKRLLGQAKKRAPWSTGK